MQFSFHPRKLRCHIARQSGRNKQPSSTRQQQGRRRQLLRRPHSAPPGVYCILPEKRCCTIQRAGKRSLPLPRRCGATTAVVEVGSQNLKGTHSGEYLHHQRERTPLQVSQRASHCAVLYASTPSLTNARHPTNEKLRCAPCRLSSGTLDLVGRVEGLRGFPHCTSSHPNLWDVTHRTNQRGHSG